MSVETGGPVTGGLLLPKEKEREELMHGGKIYWGLISFRDSHSRDEEVKRFIADYMSQPNEAVAGSYFSIPIEEWGI